MTSDNNSMGRLADVLSVLPDGVAALRADVHAAEEARKKANRLNTSLLVVAVLLVAVVGIVGWQNNRLANQVRDTNAHIADCTTAGGQCYEQGRARSNQAITAVVRISILVSQCGRLYPGESGAEYDQKLERCVLGRLAQTQPTPGTTPGTTPSTTPSVQPTG